MISSTDNFHRWFEGSHVHRNGVPLVQFHGTQYPIYDEPFWRFTHFGTSNCSNLFLWRHIKNADTATLYPVLLSIKNPVYMEDIGHHGATYISDTLTDMGIFTQRENDTIQKFCRPIFVNGDSISTRMKDASENADILSAQRNCARATKDFPPEKHSIRHAPYFYHAFEGYRMICDLLNKKGYDGMAYHNDHEDDGSLSWAITRPDQVLGLFDAIKIGIPYHMEYHAEIGNIPKPHWVP
jgi:hypothetical protein